MYKVFIAVLFVICCLTVPIDAWSVGDVVPILVSYRINRTSTLKSIALPNEYNPRFGVDRIVQIPSLDFFDEFQDVAVRFELGRGLRKQSLWFPVKKSGDAKHLVEVAFDFGYQQSTFARFTTFRLKTKYSERAHASMQMRYVWNEHRNFNPHIALSMLCLISVLCAAVLGYHVAESSLATFGSTNLVVRDRSE